MRLRPLVEPDFGEAAVGDLDAPVKLVEVEFGGVLVDRVGGRGTRVLEHVPVERVVVGHQSSSSSKRRAASLRSASTGIAITSRNNVRTMPSRAKNVCSWSKHDMRACWPSASM